MSNFDERDLSRELRERSEQVGGHPIGLDAVKGRARRIQRRRRVAGVVAAVAVAAVAVPVGLNLTGTSSTGTGPVGQPTPTAASASPTPTELPSKPADDGSTVPVVPAELPAGAAPAVPWLEGRTLHHDGTTTELPAAYADVAGYRGGWLAVENTDRGNEIVRIDSSGQVTGRAPGSVRIVTSADGTQLAWVEDGALHRGLASGHSEAEDTRPVPKGYDAQVVGFASGGAVVYTLLGTTDKNADDQTVHITDFTDDRTVPGLTFAQSSNEEAGLVAGQTGFNPDTGSACYAMVLTSGRRLWPDCRRSAESISPAGRFVTAQTSGCDEEIGCGQLFVRQADTGEPVVDFQAPRRTKGVSFGSVAWEDEEHLLGTAYTYSSGQWWLLRFGIDGSAEVVAGPVKGVEYEPAFSLPSR